MTAAGTALEVAAGSVVGNRYPENFDVYRVAVDDSGAVVAVAVADGMGDGEGSRIAGRTAIDTFTAAVLDGAREPGALRRATAEVQRRVRAAGRDLANLCGCTLTALVLPPGTDTRTGTGTGTGTGSAWLVQLGDSRVYRLRAGQLELLTVDHTMAWLGLLHGWYPPDSRQARAARYHLLRYVGHPDEPGPDLMHVDLRPGDTLCLCTDGVADQVDYWRLAAILGRPGPLSGIVDSILAETLDAGGDDNATTIVIRVSGAAVTDTAEGAEPG